MIAIAELEDKFYQQSIHVCHWQNAQYIASWLNVFADDIHHQVKISPQGTIRKHHSLRETCGSAGIVNHSQLLRAVYMIFYMLLAEILRVFMTKHLVKVFASIGQSLCARLHDREVGQVNYALYIRHLFRVDACGNNIANKQQLRL